MKTFLERYQAGEHEGVWTDLVSMGPGVRHDFYLEDARAVAAETMRRVRGNVDLLLRKLDAMGYQFLDSKRFAEERSAELESIAGLPEQILPRIESVLVDREESAFTEAMRKMQRQVASLAPKLSALSKLARRKAAAVKARAFPWEDPAIFAPPAPGVAKSLDKLEKQLKGPLPLSIRAWYEEVGSVCLMGHHPLLNPRDGEVVADPLVVEPLEAATSMLEDFGEDEFRLILSPDDLHKANTSGGDPYSMRVPDLCADGVVLDESHNMNFVEYLRLAFQWGGFPGLEREERRPEKELAILREGLTPF